MDALPLLLDWLKPRLGTKPLIIGLAGAQGSGKSTLAAQLAQRLPFCTGALPNGAGALPDAGGSVVAVSLDDFYLSKARRQALAAQIHPLFATRGPPGTHDLPLLLDVPPQHWRHFARIDVLILEGWCIGARPQPAALLAEPVNALEAAEDPHALWRTHINQALAGSYARAWAMLDALAFLAAPDWETVPRWRAQQEAGLTRATGRPGMESAAIVRFCAHYERLTRWQLADTPRHAGFTLRLDGLRRVIGAR